MPTARPGEPGCSRAPGPPRRTTPTLPRARRHDRPPVRARPARRRRAHLRHRDLRRVRVLAHRAGAQPGRRARRRRWATARPSIVQRAHREPVLPALGAASSASPSPRWSPATSPSPRSPRCSCPASPALGLRRGRGGRHRHRARAGAGHGAVDGVRRARAEEPRHRRPAAHGAGRRLAAGRVRARVPLADQRRSTPRPTRSCAGSAWSRPRSCARRARPGAQLARPRQRRAAARSTRAPPTLLDRSLRFSDRVAEELMTPRVRVESLDADDDRRRPASRGRGAPASPASR